MRSILFVLSMAAQDTPPVSAPVLPEVVLHEAFHKTMDAGGIRLRGEVGQETPFGLVIGGLGGNGPEGEFVVVRSRPPATRPDQADWRIDLDQDGDELRLFHRRGRTVQRHTWEGTGSPSVGDFAEEITRLQDWAGLLKQVDELDELSLENREVGGAACAVIGAILPGDWMASESSDPFQGALDLVTDRVLMEAAVNAATGQLHELRFEVVRTLPAQIQVQLPNEGDAPLEFVASYRLRVEEVSEQVAPEFPDDVLAWFDL